MGATVLLPRAEYLRARAKALDWSDSQTLGRVIEFWLALGAPPLSEPDAARPHIPVPKDVRVPVIRAWEKYAGKLPPASLPVRV